MAEDKLWYVFLSTFIYFIKDIYSMMTTTSPAPTPSPQQHSRYLSKLEMGYTVLGVAQAIDTGLHNKVHKKKAKEMTMTASLGP